MSSPNSASAAIPPSSTHPSSSVRVPLTLDELNRYVCQEAFNRAELPVIPPTFIGPHPPPTSSTFIGTKYLVGGPTNETPVRIMFRCVSPHDKVSRHVLMKMKPSVPEEALALKLCEVFEIPATGGVISKTEPEFVPGLSPLRVPNKGTTHQTIRFRLEFARWPDPSLQLWRKVRVARRLHGWLRGGHGRACRTDECLHQLRHPQNRQCSDVTEHSQVVLWCEFALYQML